MLLYIVGNVISIRMINTVLSSHYDDVTKHLYMPPFSRGWGKTQYIHMELVSCDFPDIFAENIVRGVLTRSLRRIPAISLSGTGLASGGAG